jgi:hypothetical protein
MSQRTLLRAVLASAGATVLMLAASSVPASAAPAMTLSSTSGPSGGGNTLTGTVPASAMAFPAGTTPTVQFQYIGTGSTACSASARDVAQIDATGATATAGVLTVDPAAVKRISATKVAFVVPSAPYPPTDDDGNASTINPTGLSLAGSQTSARWNVCVYDGPSTTASTLLAAAVYTVAIRPAITAILPASSPAGGGQTITVDGVGFGTTGTSLTASIGGIPLTGITVAPNGNSFTAVTGPRASATGLVLTVNTPGGTVSSLDPDNDSATNDAPILFAYSNGIVITPNTAAGGSTVNIDVNGAGFQSMTFSPGGAPTSGDAHVFLVSGAYDASDNRGVAECVVDSVVSDNELICTIDLSADRLDPADSTTVANTPVEDGAYILTVVADGAIGASDANPSIISSGAAFVVGPY